MKGKTTVRFVGGSQNGKTDEIQSRLATEKLSFRKGIHYAQLDDGSVGVMDAGYGELHPNWFGYQIEVYKKQMNSSGEITYEYETDELIGRCAAITKQGTRCKHSSSENAKCCPTHSKHGGALAKSIYVIE